MSQENTNQKLVNYISRIAAEAGAAKAIEIYQAQEAERIKDNESKKFKNVKLLLKEYRNLRAYAENALCDASQINDLVIRELIGFSEYEKYKVESIKNQIVTTKTIMEHVQTMLDIYKIRCTSSVREDMQRRWRVVEAAFITGETTPTYDEIAEREIIDSRTMYKDIDKACKDLSSLIFGLNVSGLET